MPDLSFRKPAPGYTWSQDYKRLINSMIDGAVIAIVLYDTMGDGTKIFDVCFMLRKPVSEKHVKLVASVRGIEYFSAREAGEFVELCEKYEVKFLDPQEIVRLRAALTASGIPAQAELDDLAPPLKITVERAKEIMEAVDG